MSRSGRTQLPVDIAVRASARVLAVDTDIDADTLDKLIVERRLDRPPLHCYDLPAGTTVVVDEAAIVATRAWPS